MSRADRRNRVLRFSQQWRSLGPVDKAFHPRLPGLRVGYCYCRTAKIKIFLYVQEHVARDTSDATLLIQYNQMRTTANIFLTQVSSRQGRRRALRL